MDQFLAGLFSLMFPLNPCASTWAPQFTAPEDKQVVQSVCEGATSADLSALIAQGVEKRRAYNGPADALKMPLTQGFYPVASAELPPAVREAGDSVYQLLIYYTPPDDTARVFNTSVMEDFVNAQPAGHDAFFIKIIRSTAAACRAKGLEKCVLPVDLDAGGTGGSGFLTGENGTRFRTASHVLEHALEGAGLAETCSAAKFAQCPRAADFVIFLFDRNGELAASSPENPFRTVAAGDPQTANDIWEIEFQQRVGKGLAQAKRPLRSGETAYLLGYPFCTGCQASYGQAREGIAAVGTRFPFPDAPGDVLVETHGPVGAPDQWGYVDVAADSAPGFSGGVVLNGGGEAVGAVSQLRTDATGQPDLTVRRTLYSPLQLLTD